MIFFLSILMTKVIKNNKMQSNTQQRKEGNINVNKIKEFRKNKRISQSDIAKIMEVTQNTVSQWETGERMPGVVQALRLADILGTTVESLYK